MKWPEIRNQYPDRWVLVEAISAYSSNNKRYINEMAFIADFIETKDAWTAYKDRHLSEPAREYYIFFTSNETLEVLEQPFIGI
jgi:hypothetical protein